MKTRLYDYRTWDGVGCQTTLSASIALNHQEERLRKFPSIEQLCLSRLYREDASGYDILKWFSEGRGAAYAEASPGALYPALKKLVGRSLAIVRTEEQHKLPSRKIYSITEGGRNLFMKSLFDIGVHDRFASPFLLLMEFADLVPAHLLSAKIFQRRDALENELGRLNGWSQGDGGADVMLQHRKALLEALLRVLNEL